ncbi:non-ribosomal peptide synthetase module [Fodinisporobacter ferrooxydans]|uniref:Non-ribosomal peptide synthetase module n=1 Tax=Fodinisporobacter ferrooxydans TaxID=2901836 RepID=A0ABY4CGH7_9BACL|nr:non-ribosomal peptide synthetase module [Alicyclobacillaceae bacterium MYW30-H2]
MARRVATDYKHIRLELSPQALQTFMNLFEGHHAVTQVFVYENGDTELILHDHEKQIPLVFHPNGSHYLFEGSFCIEDLQLANTVRKAIHSFKGEAIVQRIYPTNAIEYHYDGGEVIKIQELKGNTARVIYEYKNPVRQFQQLYSESWIECQAEWIQLQIDLLLDQRSKRVRVEEIDEKLKVLAHELFLLEG